MLLNARRVPGSADGDRTEIRALLSMPCFSYDRILFRMTRRAVLLSLLIAAGLMGADVAGAGVQTAPGERRERVPAERAPWLGTWQLITPNPGRFEAAPYKKVTIRIEPQQDGIAVVYDMVRTRGGVSHMEWAGRFDGRDYPVQGVDYVLTNAYRQIDDRSYEITIKRDGRLAATAVAVVSADGTTLTVTTTEKDAMGRAVTTAAAYRKV
jgi:hypothetical protein